MDLYIDEITLEELCIRVIGKEFSRITMSGTTVPESQLSIIQEKNLKFLQKFYSKRLLEELIDKDELEEEHLDFLLNEYLKEVKITELVQFTSKENLIKKLIPIAHSLDVLCCDLDPTDTDEMDEEYIFILKLIIPHAVSVSEMKFAWLTLFDDEMLKLVACSCPQLTKLDVSHSCIHGSGLRSFYTNPDGSIKAECLLKHINLVSYKKIEDEEVAGLLENVPSLEEVLYERLPHVLHIILQKNVNTESDVLERKKFNLTELYFSSSYFDLLKSCSDMCPNVKKILIHLSTSKKIELLYLFPKLENFDFESSLIPSEINVNNLLVDKGKNLKVLSLKRCELSISTLIESCVNLERLQLIIVQCQPKSKQLSNVVTHLKTLKLSVFDFSDNDNILSVMALLKSSPELECLSFVQCKSFESNFVTLLTTYFLNCKLKKLKFNINNIGFETVQQFVLSCSSLSDLFLSCNSCFDNDKDVSELKRSIFALHRNLKIYC